MRNKAFIDHSERESRNYHENKENSNRMFNFRDFYEQAKIDSELFGEKNT